MPEFAVVDRVDGPPFRCGDRVDDLAAARRGVEHLRWRAHAPVQIGGDFVPDRLPSCLIDVAEAVLIQALVVDSHSERHSRIASQRRSSAWRVSHERPFQANDAITRSHYAVREGLTAGGWPCPAAGSGLGPGMIPGSFG